MASAASATPASILPRCLLVSWTPSGPLQSSILQQRRLLLPFIPLRAIALCVLWVALWRWQGPIRGHDVIPPSHGRGALSYGGPLPVILPATTTSASTNHRAVHEQSRSGDVVVHRSLGIQRCRWRRQRLGLRIAQRIVDQRTTPNDA